MQKYLPSVKTVLLCIALFLFFLMLRFPYQNFRGYLFGKIYANTKILIVAEDIYPSFFGWPGVGIKQVDVTLPLGKSELDLSADKVIARVGLAGLFPPVPSFSLAMRDLKKGGDLDVKFSQSGSLIDASIEADEVELEQLKFSALAQAIVGQLDADGELQMNLSDLSKASGDIELDVRKLKLPSFNIPMSVNYSFVIPSMNVGVMKAKIKIRNGVAEINSLQLGGPGSDLQGSITGDVKLGKTLMSSVANVILRLQFSDAIKNSSQAVTMLSSLNTFKNAKTGAYAIKCSRSFQEAAACLILPEAVPD